MYIILGVMVSAMTLVTCGCCDRKNMAKYSRELTSAASKERNEAALQLARCGREAAAAVPQLSQMLYDENAGVQSSAAYALREIDTDAARRALDAAQKARHRH